MCDCKLVLSDPEIENDSLIIAGIKLEGLKEDRDTILRKIPLLLGQRTAINNASFALTREKACKTGNYFLQTINVSSDKSRRFAYITLTYVKRH